MITRTIEPLPKSTQRTHIRFRTWITPVLISGIVLLLLVACGPADAPESLTYPASPQWPEKTPPVEADNPDSLTYPYFPKLVEQTSAMEARTQGELVLENGCIRLKDMGNTDYLLIWPPRFELTVDGEDIRIRDDSGVSLSVGETIELGGGEKKIAHLKTMVEPPIPNHCPGPYWIIGEIQTPYFPRLVEQRSLMEARTQGELVLENGCIRLKDMGNTDYLLIWPPRFELTVDGEDIRIRDDSGVSLSVGETIIPGGGEKKIAHLKTMVEPPIPTHCPGPYWVIGQIQTPVYFPRNSPDWKPFVIETVALLYTLEMKDDCLLFSTPATADHPGYLVVWPPDYRLHFGPDGVEVQTDTFTARPGDRVRVGPSAVNAPDIPFADRDRCLGYELYHIWKATNVTEQLHTAPAQPTETPVTMSSDDALTQDATSYAKAVGVSVEEAKRRLLLQRPIGELNAMLENNESETFGGLWIDNESPEYKAIVAFTSDGEATVAPYAEELGLASVVEVRTVDATLEDLRTIQADATNLVQGVLGIRVESGISVQKNRVEIYVANPDALDRALKKAGKSLHSKVDVVEIS